MHTTLLNKYRNMVNAELIIQLTNAMYATPENSPQYHELRDMLSSGQLLSKFWLVDELQNVCTTLDLPIRTSLVVGGWYGTLSYFLTEQFPTLTSHSMDIDERCAEYMKIAFNGRLSINPICADMYAFKYRRGVFDVIINTACEHIPDVPKWLAQLPKNQRVVLQANSNPNIEDHINCPQSLSEFEKMIQLGSVEYIGELVFPMYTRYMAIGKT